jgi:hypothetical protein
MGIYEFLRMPFGLAGAPHLFEKVIKEIWHQLSTSFLVYNSAKTIEYNEIKKLTNKWSSGFIKRNDINKKIPNPPCEWDIFIMLAKFFNEDLLN